MEQKNLVTYLSDLFALIGAWSLRYRWWVFGACVLLLGLSLWSASGVRMNNSFDSYFDESDPAYTAYQQFRDDFGSDEITFLLYDAGKYEHGVFNLELMQKIALLTERLELELPFIKEVKSLANLEVMLPTEDGIDFIELHRDFPASQEALSAFAELFMQKEMYLDGYVSADRRFGGIRIDMEKSSVDPIEEIRLDPDKGDELENVYPQVTDSALARVLAEEAFQDLHLYVSGDVPINSAYNRIANDSMAFTGLLAFTIISLLLLYFFRFSAIGLFGPMAVVLLSIVITLGFLGAVGWDMDMMFALVPTMLMALGIANAVHIINEFRIYHARYRNRQQALKETLRLVGAPCLLTSLTTAAGFMAMSISPIKTLAHLAVYTSLAVMAAFFLSITLLPFFLSFGKAQSAEKLQRKNHSPRMDKLLTGIAHFNIRHPKAILLTAAAICGIASAGIFRVTVDSNFLLDFARDVPVRVTTEYIDSKLGGSGSLTYLFDTGEADGIKEPAVLRELERFQAHVNAQTSLVKKTYSIVDLIKDINQSFNGGDPAYYRIPDSRELIAQYLLVYEISGGNELFNFVSQDYARANLEVRIPLVNSSEIARFKANMEAYQQQQPLLHSRTEFSGIGALWVRLMDYISQSQMEGVLLAFLVIAALMCFIFRSIKIGLISMIPNLAPVIITVGLIGWLGVYLDYTKLLIAPIAIGIAVDDTIHMLSRLQHEFRLRKNYQQALVATMTGVGRALMITSFTLIFGFSAYTITPMDSQFWFGILLSLTIFVALIADFFVVPALVLLLKPFGEEAEDIATELAPDNEVLT